MLFWEGPKLYGFMLAVMQDVAVGGSIIDDDEEINEVASRTSVFQVLIPREVDVGFAWL